MSVDRRQRHGAGIQKGPPPSPVNSASGRRTADEPRKAKPASAREDEVPFSFGPLNDYLGYKLRQAQTASFRHLDSAPGSADLSPGRFSLLTMIDANPGITQTRIAQAFGLDKSTLSPVIESLVRRRLISRRQSKTDRRAFGLSLTKSGRLRLHEKRAQIDAQERLMESAFTAEEHAQMLEFLDRIVAVLDDTP